MSVATSPTTTETDFLQSLKPKNLSPLWTEMARMVPAHPNPKAAPSLWKYSQARPSLMQAGELIAAEQAERRVLMLVNPAMEAPHTTDTIYGGLQLILPGETAPAHRHVAFALRFIIEGSGGFTAVEGQKMAMEPGDVILTPSWHWHDHGNEGDGPVIWLDGLDLPLYKHAPVNFAEPYSSRRYPSEPVEKTPWRYPWKDVEKYLDSLTGPHRVFHYKNGANHLSRTISAQAEMIEAGHRTEKHRETCSFIYHCYKGHGRSTITTDSGTETIDWEARDTFAVPAWAVVQHENLSSDVAYLFAINDRPLVEALGIFRAL